MGRGSFLTAWKSNQIVATVSILKLNKTWYETVWWVTQSTTTDTSFSLLLLLFYYYYNTFIIHCLQSVPSVALLSHPYRIIHFRSISSWLGNVSSMWHLSLLLLNVATILELSVAWNSLKRGKFCWTFQRQILAAAVAFCISTGTVSSVMMGSSGNLSCLYFQNINREIHVIGMCKLCKIKHYTKYCIFCCYWSIYWPDLRSVSV